MIGWLARQGHNARQLIGMIASGQTRELLYELAYRRKGLDLDSASVEALRLPASRAHWYSNSGGPQLERVLKTLRIPTGSVGLDLGCGKGGAAITLAQLPFTRVTGVDLSADLVRIATENVRRLGLTHVGFVHADASAFTDLDPYTHIYMYNPFPCAIVQDVLDNLRASLARRERELVLIYKNPLCDDAIAASGLFIRERELKPGEHWWYIYRHTPPAPR